MLYRLPLGLDSRQLANNWKLSAKESLLGWERIERREEYVFIIITITPTTHSSMLLAIKLIDVFIYVYLDIICYIYIIVDSLEGRGGHDVDESGGERNQDWILTLGGVGWHQLASGTYNIFLYRSLNLYLSIHFLSSSWFFLSISTYPQIYSIYRVVYIYIYLFCYLAESLFGSSIRINARSSSYHHWFGHWIPSTHSARWTQEQDSVKKGVVRLNQLHGLLFLQEHRALSVDSPAIYYYISVSTNRIHSIAFSFIY